MTSTEKRVVLFMGDSFATSEAGEQLGEALTGFLTSGREFELVTAGYPGLGLDHFLPDVRARIEKLHPDIVIHVYPDTDACRHYSLLKRLVFPTPRMAVKGWSFCWKFSNQLRRIHGGLGDLAWRVLSNTILREVDIRKGLEMDCESLRDFAEFLGRRNILYIVCLWDVELFGLTGRFRKSLEFLNSYPHVRFLADLNNYLATFHEWEYRIPNDGHPNALGNRLMAQYIVTMTAGAGFL